MTWVTLRMWPPKELKRLCPHDRQTPDLRCCAKDPQSDPGLLTTMARSSHVCHFAAANPSTPPAVLAELLAGGNRIAEFQAAMANAAKNPSTPLERLLAVADDSDHELHWIVARNPALPQYVIDRLSRDQDFNVRTGAAHNPQSGPEILTRLAADESLVVVRGVAENQATPPSVLRALAGHPENVVREAVAENQSTPVDVLWALRSADNDNVNRCLLLNPALPDEVLLSLPMSLLGGHPRWMELSEQLPEAAQQVVWTLIHDQVEMSGRQVLDAAHRLAGR